MPSESANSVTRMLDEIAAGLKAGDGDVYRWLAEELRKCGGSEASTQLALGVLARLLPRAAREDIVLAQKLARRWTH